MRDTRKNRYMSEEMLGRVMSQVHNKVKRDNADPLKEVEYKMRNQGKLFFESGMSLEDAPLEYKDNASFVKGYEDARDRKQEVYDLGVQKYVDGVKFKDLASIYQKNADFMQGYKDAKDAGLIDGTDWENIPDELINGEMDETSEDYNHLESRRHR